MNRTSKLLWLYCTRSLSIDCKTFIEDYCKFCKRDGCIVYIHKQIHYHSLTKGLYLNLLNIVFITVNVEVQLFERISNLRNILHNAFQYKVSSAATKTKTPIQIGKFNLTKPDIVHYSRNRFHLYLHSTSFRSKIPAV